tara:strand:+ start:139 stop:504 length:366 start_codon:yes stop_codon:yes gene_type:complete
MKLRINELRKIIRNVILEGYDERVYDDTVLPDEEADEELLAEPDLTDQKDRDDYLDKKEKSKKKKDRLRSADEIDNAMGDENTIAGGGIVGHMGGAWGPPQEHKPMKSKNAMGKKRKNRRR